MKINSVNNTYRLSFNDNQELKVSKCMMEYGIPFDIRNTLYIMDSNT